MSPHHYPSSSASVFRRTNHISIGAIAAVSPHPDKDVGTAITPYTVRSSEYRRSWKVFRV
jgi:hypothetical protein